jgi:hypothetical protein
LATDSVKHFSRSKQKKKVIQSWIVANYLQSIGDSFALGILIPLLDLILHGVSIFAAHKKRELARSIGTDVIHGKQPEEHDQQQSLTILHI